MLDKLGMVIDGPTTTLYLLVPNEQMFGVIERRRDAASVGVCRRW
jgi:hypothetical protein